MAESSDNRGRSVTIKCICAGRFNIAASQVPMPFTGAKTLTCPNCAGEWRLAWDHRRGVIRMLPPEQTHKPAEWGFKPRPTQEEIASGEVWAGPDDADGARPTLAEQLAENDRVGHSMGALVEGSDE